MRHKIERIHDIATDHGPMVQGGLLTAHPGSIHGGGEAPEGQSSLRQGAGTWSPGSPNLEWRRQQNKGEIMKNGYVLEGFRRRGKYRPKGARGWPRVSRRPPGVATRGKRHQGAWTPGGPPLDLLWGSGRFLRADFFWIFPNFLEHF